jgi:transposase InsO family protein
MCELAKAPRASYYRWWHRVEPAIHDLEFRDRIQRICLEHRGSYGYRRVTAELLRQGWVVNHKRVRRLMREDDLLAQRRHKFIATTASDHAYSVFPNLMPSLEVDGLNQLWIADLTYLRLGREFVYLSVILDAYSRRVIGWKLSRTLRPDSALAALEQAIATRNPPAGLVHHSDRGIQYACGAYVTLLHQHGLIGSMSRKGNPYDNARCESFLKTLKQEEIRCSEYADLEELERNLAEFIERYYNCRRLHSALGYLSPSAFEEKVSA